MSDLCDVLRNVLYKSNLIEGKCIVILDIELLDLLHNKPEQGLKIMMDNYMALIYTIIFVKRSKGISKNIGLKFNTIDKKYPDASKTKQIIRRDYIIGR